MKAKFIKDAINWEDGNYEPIKGKDGNYYQYYEKINPQTGEKAYLVAKYLFGYEYISQEDFEQILGTKIDEY